MTCQQGRGVITLTEAADMIGRNYGHKPSVATVWRWARKGLGGYRLATIRIGRRYRTTITAVNEFVERLSNAEPREPRATSSDRARAHAFSDSEIAEAQGQRDKEVAEAKRRLRQYCGRSDALNRQSPCVENASPSRPTTREDDRNHQKTQRSF